MKRFPNPIFGAFLNMLWFGLADLYVGHLGRGLIKMILTPFLAPRIIFLLSVLLSGKHFEVAFLFITLLYMGLVATIGYQTVRAVIDEEEKTQ